MHCFLPLCLLGLYLAVTSQAEKQQPDEESWRPILKPHLQMSSSKKNSNPRESKFSSHFKNLNSLKLENNRNSQFSELQEIESKPYQLETYSTIKHRSRKLRETNHASADHLEDGYEAIQVPSSLIENLKNVLIKNRHNGNDWSGTNQREVFVNKKVHHVRQGNIKPSTGVNNIPEEPHSSNSYSTGKVQEISVSLERALKDLLENARRTESLERQGHTSNFRIHTLKYSPSSSAWREFPVSEKYSISSSTIPSQHSKAHFSSDASSLVIKIPSRNADEFSEKLGKVIRSPQNDENERSPVSIISLGHPFSKKILTEILSVTTPDEHMTPISDATSEELANKHSYQNHATLEEFGDLSNRYRAGSQLKIFGIHLAGQHHILPTLITSFSCRDHKVPGYYADVETGCKAFHVCELNKRQHDFLCPDGTLFNQALLTCDWPQKVQCDMSSHYFTVNSDIYRPRYSSRNKH
ncbi:uncharacterized protein LOC143251211 [Tachypleus tridentatus]|uniref:uncharacterized protein LOC143251211 n=1 Tax=Tachypleus tridentatus TaxID=6853 RepID=UPI003FD69CC7